MEAERKTERVVCTRSDLEKADLLDSTAHSSGQQGTSCSPSFGFSTTSPDNIDWSTFEFAPETKQDNHEDQRSLLQGARIKFGAFVESRFIPDFVANKRYAGQAHFRAILKHVLPPESVARTFGARQTRTKLVAITGWPYMDDLRLSDITPQTIERLTRAALARGYSVQTATHIRNVVRSIFAHATKIGVYAGINPASKVKLPPMTRRETPVLTLPQLKLIMNSMRYPEKQLALFVMLTEMTVAEICGLQWKHLNLTNIGQKVDHEFIPAKAIAVRKQCYRGVLTSVIGKRRRFVDVPDILGSVLRDLKSRTRFTLPHDFVLASRNGNALRAENISVRRLKSLGKSLDMPWLSWSVFQRTQIMLVSGTGLDIHQEIEKLEMSNARG